MINHFRNILNLNDKYQYALINRLRNLLYPWFNYFLFFQKKHVETLFSKQSLEICFKPSLKNLLPEVKKSEINAVLSSAEIESILIEADSILFHKFEIFSKKIHFKNLIDWHLDFNSGYRWPKGKIFNNYHQVNIANNADVKFPRELSRCHHFLVLGEAYKITGDEKYTREFIDQIIWWINDNPYKKSINWGCAMDVAIRSSNWIYSLRMFIDSKLVTDEILLDIVVSLFLHGRFLYENPEKNRINNHNHFLSDLAGQIHLGLLFINYKLPEVENWKSNGIYDFFKEIRLQILPTGHTYERTTNYHRLVTELIGYTIVLLKNNSVEIPRDIFYRVNQMFKILNYTLSLNGYSPIIVDQDSGRFLPFYGFNINFHGYLLNIGAVLFEDEELKSTTLKNYIDVLFLFGYKEIDKIKNLPSCKLMKESKPFPDAGFFILKSDSIYVFINNSGLSHYNEINAGTHTHSDLLSFVFSYNNRPFLVDPGTYVYSSNPIERKIFRSTSMHNTITVDDYDQNEIAEDKLWFMKRNAIPKDINWKSNNEIALYKGSHSGYLRLNDPVAHTREFSLDKKNNRLEITDYIDAKMEHVIKCYFHFDNEVNVILKDNILFCENNNENIKISFQTENSFSLVLLDGFISKSYNSKIRSCYAIFGIKTKGSCEFKIIIEQ